MKKFVSVLCVFAFASITWAAHSNYGCDGCHTPHNAKSGLPEVPLWSGKETTQTFTMYSSETLDATMDAQPTGSSKLCLSCHDGTLGWMDPARQFGGEALSNSHPISFVYDTALVEQDGALKNPSEPSTLGSTIEDDLLDSSGKVQCSSCHDVHTSGVGDNLLRGYDYRHGPNGGALCQVCHLK